MGNIVVIPNVYYYVNAPGCILIFRNFQSVYTRAGANDRIRLGADRRMVFDNFTILYPARHH